MWPHFDLCFDPDLLELGGYDLARIHAAAIAVLEKGRAEPVWVCGLGQLGFGFGFGDPVHGGDQSTSMR